MAAQNLISGAFLTENAVFQDLDPLLRIKKCDERARSQDLINTLLTRYKPFSGKLSSSSNPRLCVLLTGGQFEASS